MSPEIADALYEAALDQPNPTAELKRAIKKVTSSKKHSTACKSGRAGYIVCPLCSGSNHARKHYCASCGYDLFTRFVGKDQP